jgi:hypothetical protein
LLRAAAIALEKEACAPQISRSARRTATNPFRKYGPKLEKSGEEVFSFHCSSTMQISRKAINLNYAPFRVLAQTFNGTF